MRPRSTACSSAAAAAGPFAAATTISSGCRPQALAGLVVIAAEGRQREAFGDGLGDDRRRVRAEQEERQARNPPLACEGPGGGRELAESLGVGLGRTAAADERDAMRPPAAAAEQRRHEELIRARAELARFRGATQLAGGGGVELGNRVGRRLPLEERHDEQAPSQSVVELSER